MANDNFDVDTDSSLPRRQNVIGGNLSGVSKNKRFGWLRRFGDSNITIWALGTVILLVIAAFLWPQNQGDITEEVTRKLNTNQVIAIDDKISLDASTGKASFTDDNDQARADAYRAEDKIDQEITKMLQQADQYIRARQFTLPAGDNAVSVYNKVLAIRPANAIAIESLEKIRRHYEFRGVTALEENQLSVAQKNLTRLGTIDKSSDEYQNLAADIAAYRYDQELAQALSNTRKSIQQGNLFEPDRNNGIFYVNRALALDSNNAKAKELLQEISDQLVEQANDKILGRNFTEAKKILAALQEHTPEHQSLPLLDAMLSNALNPPVTKAALEEQPQPTATGSDSGSAKPDRSTATPPRQASEQAEFDRQYLKKGLSSYQSGDYAAAITLLQPLADKGISRAQLKLALMSYLGLGFDQDVSSAQKIVNGALPAVRKFANEGRGWAQSDLGQLYEVGLVLPRDLSEAVYWYRSAADAGDASAQFHLGNLYELGNGVTINRQTAIEWYQLAAKQGHPGASRKLANLGVSKAN